MVGNDPVVGRIQLPFPCYKHQHKIPSTICTIENKSTHYIPGALGPVLPETARPTLASHLTYGEGHSQILEPVCLLD
eukprot:1153469-Pelagomonas_calceolata.AAC.7